MEKKYQSIILFVLLLSFIANLYSFDTVIEAEVELEYSNWIQNMLEPILGKTLVDVNFELEYPEIEAKTFGMDLDETQSLPGLPVAKSTNVAEPIDNEEYRAYTKVLSKSITILVSEKINDNTIEAIRNRITEWFDLDELNGDTLNIEKSLLIKEKRNYNLLFNGLLLLILLLFIQNFKSGMKFLAKSMKRIHIMGIEQSVHIRGSVNGNQSTSALIPSSGEMNFTADKPLKVSIMKEEVDYSESDFNFLNQIDAENLIELLRKEVPDDMILILTKVDPKLVSKIMEDNPEIEDEIIKFCISPKEYSVLEIKKLRETLKKEIDNLIEEKEISNNGSEILVDILYTYPIAKTVKLLKKIELLDKEFAKAVRNEIILPNDILKMDSHTIKLIIKNTGHSLLTDYLACSGKQIQEVFYRNMTERSKLIIQEDIALLEKFSSDEKEQIIDMMMHSIKKILNRG